MKRHSWFPSLQIPHRTHEAPEPLDEEAAHQQEHGQEADKSIVDPPSAQGGGKHLVGADVAEVAAYEYESEEQNDLQPFQRLDGPVHTVCDLTVPLPYMAALPASAAPQYSGIPFHKRQFLFPARPPPIANFFKNPLPAPPVTGVAGRGSSAAASPLHLGSSREKVTETFSPPAFNTSRSSACVTPSIWPSRVKFQEF